MLRVEAINRNRVKLQVHFNCVVKPTEIIQQTALLTANPLKAGFQVLDGLLRLGCLRFLLVVVNVVFDLGLTERDVAAEDGDGNVPSKAVGLSSIMPQCLWE